MQANSKWVKLGWRHPLWNLVRFYLSLRGSRVQEKFIEKLSKTSQIDIDENETIPIPSEAVKLFFEYITKREDMFTDAMSQLRTENEAQEYCSQNDLSVGVTKTKNNDHHQASKALIAAVTGIAKEVCSKLDVDIDEDPQKRCVWCYDNELHVTARNLDGAIPGLMNPFIIWEIKEYWGKTKGGSKMSDAVYECQLVGYELLDYKDRTGKKIHHVVFLDGRDQWGYRKSDLKRFIDLLNQGLIDYLMIGKEVESGWKGLLEKTIIGKKDIFQA